MQRIDVEVPTPEGVCPTILITPDGDGPFAPVILFTDAGGVRAAMVEMAERLAAMGYAAFLPEMFYRDAPYAPFDLGTVFGDPDERVRLFAMMGKLTTEAGIDHTVEFYPALHGFAVTDNVTYDPSAAERHWTALDELYAAKLSR